MKTIVIAANKGGQGKTTSVVSIAAGLHKKGYKILLIDTDSQANLSLIMGFGNSESERMGRNIATLLLGMRPLPEVIRSKDGIDLIPSSIQVAGYEKQIAADVNANFLIKEMLEPLNDSYDFCIIDTPPSMSSLTIASIVAADYLYIPCEPEYLSIQGLNTLIKFTESVKKHQNKDLSLSGIFFTKYAPSYRKTLHHQIFSGAKEQLGKLVMATTIRENVALGESNALNTNIFDYAPESNGAKDYASLIEEILKTTTGKKTNKSTLVTNHGKAK